MSGQLFLVTGPAGAGKTTMVHHCIEELGGLNRVITNTTRAARKFEENAVCDYFFVTLDEYAIKKADSSNWFEIEIYEAKYGLCFESLLKNLNEGKSYIMTIYPSIETIQAYFENFSLFASLIFIDTSLLDCQAIITSERPASELLRIETDSQLDIDEIRDISNYIFTPTRVLEADQKAFSELVRSLLVT